MSMSKTVPPIVSKQQLAEKANRLRSRILDRPNDRRALKELYMALYELREYDEAVTVAEKAISCGETSGEVFAQYGRCLFRKWSEGKRRLDLEAALTAFRTAMTDNAVNRQPVVYLELVAINLRLGRYQDALDTLGALMVMFKTMRHLTAVAQYNVAIILCLSGQFNEAVKLYQDLVLCPFEVDVELAGVDHVILIPTRMAEPVLYIELAALMLKLGHHTHAVMLLKENFDRVRRYRYSGFDSEIFNSIMLSSPSFDAWFTNHKTFQGLGDFFKSNNNLFMASEMYSVAANTFSGATPLSSMDEEHRELIQNLYLKSAECLAEMGSFRLAEQYAHQAYDMSPHDMIVVDRAAKCCRKGVKANEEIFNSQRIIWKACRRVHAILRGKLLRRRLIIEKRRERAATLINAFVRMVLSRNRTAGDRLSEVSICRINKLQAYLSGKVLKKGKDQLQMWSFLWYTSAVQIQCALRTWFARQRYFKFRRGCRVMKRVFRGQITRRYLRNMVEKLQSELNLLSFVDSRKSELMEEFDTNLWPFYVDLYTIKRLCSGYTCVSAEESFAGLTSASEASSPLRPRDRMERRALNKDGISVLKLRELSQRSMASLHSPPKTVDTAALNQKRLLSTSDDRPEMRAQRRPQKGVYVCPVSHNSEEPSLPPLVKESAHATEESLFSDRNVSDMGRSVSSSTAEHGNMPLCPETKTGLQLTRRANSSAAQSLFKPVAPNMNITITRMSEQDLRLNKRDPLPAISISHSQSMGMATHSSVEELIRDPAEDVVSFISLTSLSRDPTRQWVPFGIMPDSEIMLLLKCTVLVITSPSFGMQDSRRLCAIASKNPDTWPMLRSLIIFGTRMGESGLRMLVSLGLSHLHSLTLGNTGMSHHILQLIGEQLMQKNSNGASSVFNTSSLTNLSKIYIEHESNMGDRGVVQLVKCLQLNSTIRVLSFRHCSLGARAAKAVARYISQAISLEVVNLSDNRLNLDSCTSLVRAVANKGAKGYFRRLYLKTQTPELTQSELLSLYQVSSALGVGFSADNLNVVDETKSELFLNVNVEEGDMKRMHAAFNDMVRENRLLAAGEVSYKKTVLL